MFIDGFKLLLAREENFAVLCNLFCVHKPWKNLLSGFLCVSLFSPECTHAHLQSQLHNGWLHILLDIQAPKNLQNV